MDINSFTPALRSDRRIGRASDWVASLALAMTALCFVEKGAMGASALLLAQVSRFETAPPES